MAYNKLGDYKHALADFNNAIEIDPNDANSHICRGIIYAMFDNVTQTLADFNKAIEINPTMPSSTISGALHISSGLATSERRLLISTGLLQSILITRVPMITVVWLMTN